MKLLFITWDSDQTNYLESLFLPILQGLQEKYGYTCRVLQFSWAQQEKVEALKQQAAEKGIDYTHYRVKRGPHPTVGAALTVLKGSRYLKKYLQQYPVDIIMPRSTMPALMTNRILPWLHKQGAKVLFDADGLPLEERLDFSSLKRTDFQFKFLKSQELLMLKNADAVLTRTQKAIDLHMKHLDEECRSKFFVVSNGRSAERFFFQETERKHIRKVLGMENGALLWVYTGTLGPQYAWEDMLAIFGRHYAQNPQSRFLVLTSQTEYVTSRLPREYREAVKPLKIPFDQVPSYLSASDRAFCLRVPADSMQGVAPIKLGEYLLMGLPTIVSMGIGDVEEVLSGQSFVHLFDHHDTARIARAQEWVEKSPAIDPGEIRDFALKHYTLETSIRDYAQALEYLSR